MSNWEASLIFSVQMGKEIFQDDVRMNWNRMGLIQSWEQESASKVDYVSTNTRRFYFHRPLLHCLRAEYVSLQNSNKQLQW